MVFLIEFVALTIANHFLSFLDLPFARFRLKNDGTVAKTFSIFVKAFTLHQKPFTDSIAQERKKALTRMVRLAVHFGLRL